MRKLSSVWILALGLLTAARGSAGGQEPNDSGTDRGPRFLLASTAGHERVPVDVHRTPSLRRRISVAFGGVALKQALDEISRQANLQLIYSRHVVPLESRVHLKADSITVAGALSEVLMDAGVDVVLSPDGRAALAKRPGVVPVQTGTIVGLVTDKRTEAPIAGASVEVQGSHLGATTAADGRYRISDVPPGTYAVRARYIGYAPLTGTVTVSADGEQTVDFALEKSVAVLEELVTTTPGGVQTQVRAIATPVTIITADQIEQQRPQTINNVFRQAVPGAVSYESPSQPVTAQFAVRGATSLGGPGLMKVLVDGMEAANFSENPIDPASIERIEVIRGPQAATVYGPDAAQGVVQVFTKRGDPTRVRPEVTVRTEAGVLQTPDRGYEGVVRTSMGAEVRGGSPDGSYLLGGSWWQLPTWVVEGGSSTKQSVPSIYGGVRLARGIVSADLSGRYMVVNNYLNFNPLLRETGFIGFSQPQYLAQKFTTEAVSFRVGVDPVDWWRNRFSVGFDGKQFSSVQEQPRRTTPSDTLLRVLDNTTSKTFLGYNTSLYWAPRDDFTGTLIAGIDHYRLPVSQGSGVRVLNTTGSVLPGPGGVILLSRSLVKNTGYFAQLEVGMWQRLFVTAGLRGDNNSTFGEELASPVAPRLGVAYTHDFGSTTVKARAAYGRAIRAAAPGQTFGASLPTQVTLANPLLRPERQRGWDAGLDLVLHSGASLSVTGYDQTAEDLILFVQLAIEPVPTFQFQNVGRVENRGIEVEGRVPLLGDRLHLRGQYAYTHSRIEDLGPNFGGVEQVGDRPAGVPTHTAGGSATFALGSRTTFTGGLTYVGSFVENDALAQFSCIGGTGPCNPTGDYRTEYPGFVKINLSVSQQFASQFTAWFAVSNLTDNEAYEASNTRPVQGRLTSIGVQARY